MTRYSSDTGVNTNSFSDMLFEDFFSQVQIDPSNGYGSFVGDDRSRIFLISEDLILGIHKYIFLVNRVEKFLNLVYDSTHDLRYIPKFSNKIMIKTFVGRTTYKQLLDENIIMARSLIPELITRILCFYKDVKLVGLPLRKLSAEDIYISKKIMMCPVGYLKCPSLSEDQIIDHILDTVNLDPVISNRESFVEVLTDIWDNPNYLEDVDLVRGILLSCSESDLTLHKILEISDFELLEDIFFFYLSKTGLSHICLTILGRLIEIGRLDETKSIKLSFMHIAITAIQTEQGVYGEKIGTIESEDFGNTFFFVVEKLFRSMNDGPGTREYHRCHENFVRIIRTCPRGQSDIWNMNRWYDAIIGSGHQGEILEGLLGMYYIYVNYDQDKIQTILDRKNNRCYAYIGFVTCLYAATSNLENPDKYNIFNFIFRETSSRSNQYRLKYSWLKRQEHHDLISWESEPISLHHKNVDPPDHTKSYIVLRCMGIITNRHDPECLEKEVEIISEIAKVDDLAQIALVYYHMRVGNMFLARGTTNYGRELINLNFPGDDRERLIRDKLDDFMTFKGFMPDSYIPNLDSD